jgi:hypothetical protein
MQVQGSILKAVGKVCVKPDETGDKHKAFVHLLAGGKRTTLEATNGGCVVQVDIERPADSDLACVIPKGTIARLRAKDEVYVTRPRGAIHKLEVEKETDRFERTLERDDGKDKSLPEPFPDLREKFDDMPSGSGGFEVSAHHMLQAVQVLSALGATRLNIRTSKRKGAPYCYLVGVVDDETTARVAIGCADMFGAPDPVEDDDEDGGEAAAS